MTSLSNYGNELRSLVVPTAMKHGMFYVARANVVASLLICDIKRNVFCWCRWWCCLDIVLVFVPLYASPMLEVLVRIGRRLHSFVSCTHQWCGFECLLSDLCGAPI